ncbi:hypothetical protein BGZ68_008156 [Mortierella alpina]|nr:hypothetical protein BGZ68_008156 [Mortierella alpina]
MEQRAEQTPGIITVVDQSDEEEDEALVALRNLPKFEPLVVPEAASHFSLSSVFGALATSTDTRHDASERAFNPNVVVDILVQMNAHNKKCALDIQDFQRSLGIKMKALDEFTTGAVQELCSVHQQAKTHADHLLSAQITTTLLHGIVDKLATISHFLDVETGSERKPSPDYLPNLYKYLHQSSPAHTEREATGLALLGQGSSSSSPAARRMNQPRQNPTRNTAALSMPKARASMALVSSALSYLNLGDPSELDQLSAHSTRNQTSASATPENPQTTTALTGTTTSANVSHTSLQQQLQQHNTAQQPSLRATDNLRRLANKSPSHAASTTPHRGRFI